MSVESETGSDVIEQKLSSYSPTMQNDLSLDGDVSTTQNNSLSDDAPSASLQNNGSEPKAKKRRKQSNPLKIQNALSPKFEVPPYELEQSESEESPVSYTLDEGLSNQSLSTEKNKHSDYASQKGSLSRVTNALYNNKIKEAAKVNKIAIKSKESSLQSPTDVSSPESTEDVIPNNEYKNSLQNAYSQMPPLLPTVSDVANDASKIASIYNFSEFSSPVQQGNINLPVSHRSFITSNGVRVFNPEAYCELCEKEFCNKYFLKTHKANKHGICSSENNSSGYNYRLSYKNMHMNPQVTQQMITQMCENGATFGSADSYCNICQKYFCNKYFLKKHRQNIHGIHENQETSSNVPSSIHVPVISPLPLVRTLSHDSKSIESSGLGTKDDDSSINVSLENIKNSINCTASLLNGSSPHNASQSKTTSLNTNQKEKKGDKYLCELCNIEFCDKFYLDAHKQNKHGSAKINMTDFREFLDGHDKPNSTDDGEESKSSFKGQMCTPCMKNFSSAESFQNHMLETHGASIKEEDDSSRLSETYRKNDLCNFEKDASEKSPMLEKENSNSSTESGSFNCTLCFMKCKDKSSFLSHMESEHCVFGSFGSDGLSLVSDSIMSCDSCHEQFPDRLTLVSHKLKSHGIISPGLGALMDSGENGDYVFSSGGRLKGVTSFCQICNKELCNKYFMKTHMLKMHGIDVDKIQLVSNIDKFLTSGGVYCDICQKYLCSKYFLKIHKQNVHGIMDDSLKTPMIGSPYNSNMGMHEKRFSGNQSQIANNLSSGEIIFKEEKQNSVFSCDICGQEFSSKLMLQVHLVEKHVKCYESKFSNIDVNSFSHLAEDFKEGGVLPCSCCSYVNLDDNLKSSQVSSNIKIISCVVCSMTYPLNEYHTHHLSHGTSLPIGKKLPKIENGLHDAGSSFSHSGNNGFDPSNKNKLRPRKFKRFRCSKCDKTFRTKVKCLNHIQIMHKSKKSLLNQCDPQNTSKKTVINNVSRKNAEFKPAGSGGTENGSLNYGKESGEKSSPQGSGFHDATLPVPYVLPNNSDVIMQPFHLSEPKPEGSTKQDIFVPSLVYLPVSQKVSEPLTVAFTLTPA